MLEFPPIQNLIDLYLKCQAVVELIQEKWSVIFNVLCYRNFILRVLF